jgi:hypothetical protein
MHGPLPVNMSFTVVSNLGGEVVHAERVALQIPGSVMALIGSVLSILVVRCFSEPRDIYIYIYIY